METIDVADSADISVNSSTGSSPRRPDDPELASCHNAAEPPLCIPKREACKLVLLLLALCVIVGRVPSGVASMPGSLPLPTKSMASLSAPLLLTPLPGVLLFAALLAAGVGALLPLALLKPENDDDKKTSFPMIKPDVDDENGCWCWPYCWLI